MADDPTFERNLGSDGSHGINFEWETTLLTYLRCEKLHQDWKKNNDTGVKSFFVANNVKGVGAFDDVVVRVECVEEGEVRTKLLFCQCKHVEGATKRGDKISDYKQNTKQCDSKKYGEEIETQMKLKSLIERDDQRSDITTHLFSNTLGNEYRLSDEWCLDNLKCDAEIDKLKDSIIEEFCKMFRVFLKQDDKLDIQINSAIKDCCCTEIIDIDVLRTTMLEEMKLIFGSNSNSSTALTVKTSLLSKLKRFLELKKSSESTLNHHRQNLKISSRESIEESEENSIMILSNEEDVEKFNIANKSQTYMQAKKVYVYVARNIKLPSGPGKNEIFVQIEGSDVDQSAANWVHHLSDKSENIIESSIGKPAISFHNVEGFEYLLKQKCIRACQLGHTAAVEVLIKHKCSVNERYNDGDTPLHVAAQEGHDKIIVALLTCDISMINVTNDRGETALHVACLFGRTAVVEVLIKHKCSVNERNSNVKFLLANDCIFDTKDKENKTPLDYARNRGEKDIVELLEEKGSGRIMIDSGRNWSPFQAEQS
ncbi:hypothetical protein B566_EDAN018509, partial [Ephemera danica]